jgi:hypothetical protein
MTVIPGERDIERRRNIHGKDGTHLFPHPEQYEPRRSRWTAWERAYAAHLDRHKELIRNPEPVDSDPQVVADLFLHIEHLKTIIEKEKRLIAVIREKLAAGAELDEKDTASLRRITRDR